MAVSDWVRKYWWVLAGVGIYYAVKSQKKQVTTARAEHRSLEKNVRLLPGKTTQRGFCGGGMEGYRNPKGDLFAEGNSKLGKHIWAFSLPRVTTCPGRSDWCNKNCYMEKVEKLYPTTLPAYERNYQETLKADFPDKAIEELTRRDKNLKYRLVRVHVDGDFYNAEYIRKWIRIVKALPDFQFYAYTKSWRVAKLLPVLNELRRLPNMIMRASTDESTQKPPAGWLEAGINECLTSPKSYTCHFYDNKIKCDTCRVCGTKEKSITLKAHR
jgi:hypothetical protein